MLRETGIDIEAAAAAVPEGPREATPGWRAVDRALRTIARRRAGLDAEEAHWVREAEALQIWRPLGMVSMLDYLERAMGYAPRSGLERLRVARALGVLPRLTAALAAGDLAFSAVRELTRVATPATEAEWIAAAAEKNLRQIEDLVAGHREGDRPGDPPDPQARRYVVRYEVSAETFALLRQARTVIDDEHGTNRSDDEFLAALCSTVIDGGAAGEPTGRAKFQIAVTVCERCRQGWQEGRGAQIPIGAAAVDRAMCDAQHIGSIDGAEPARAYQDIPPSVARFVWRRDGGRCRTPGCRSSRGLELHHLAARADGGSHDAMNLALICSACHQAHHEGTLTITGTADRIEVRRHGDASSAGEPCAHVGAGGVPGTAPQPGHEARAPHLDLSAEAQPRSPHAEPQPSAKLGQRSKPSTNRDVTAHVGARIEPAAESRRRTPSDPNGEPRPRVGVEPALLDNDVGEEPPTRLDAAIRRSQTKETLIGLGWKPAIASAAVAAAWARVGSRATLEQLILEALRQCPRPSATSEGGPRSP